MNAPSATDLATLGAVDVARLVQTRAVSAREVAWATVDRIARLNPALNALVQFDADAVIDAAGKLDRRIEAGERVGPLAGAMVSVKDNLWVAGARVSQGSRRFADFTAPESAFAVDRALAAGTLVIGISNCSEFACKGVTTNRLYGTTSNPWNLGLTPGGSSGGAAAAVAAGLGHAALCTDGGGSTRRPASHTGVVGMKPTAGLVPHPVGFAEPVFGNSVVGQMARRVADVVALLDAIAAPSLADPQGVPVPLFLAADANPQTLPRTLRIAYSPTFGLDVPVDGDVSSDVAAAVDRLAVAGFRIERADPVWPEGAGESALMPLQLAGLAALYGEALKRGEWDADPDIAAQIEAGLRVSGVEVAQALFARDAFYKAFDAFFARFDLLITPTTPCTAWPHTQNGPSEIGARAVGPRGHAVFTPLINHCLLPACSVPCGLDRKGLPIGLQIIGPRFSDARVLALAAHVEQQCPHDFSQPVTPLSVINV